MKKLVLCFLMGIACLGADAQRDRLSRAASAQKEKMNVIVFLVDDMGWSDLGCYGSKFYRTPQINHFAKESVRFTQAYASSHVCSPSRAGLISGEYPARLHLTDWLPGRQNFSFQRLKNASIVQHLPYGKPTLPEVLKEHGYQTAIFGKWHLGDDSVSTERQGFELHVPQWNKGWPNGTYFAPYHMKGLEGGPQGEYLTDRLTTEALKWVEKNKEHPFFLFLSHFAVHDPIEGPPHLVEKYVRRMKHSHPQEDIPYILEQNPDTPNPLSRKELNALLQDTRYQGYSILPNRTVKIKQYQDNPEYAAMVESVDESLGRVLAKLKELGLSDNTIVIFTSDNGGMSGANLYHPTRKIPLSMLNASFSTSNLPLRGGKGWLYEGGIRVPLLVYWPGKGQHGTACKVPVINTDFYPTILDMLGMAPPAHYPIDGKSFVPLLKGDRKGSEGIEKRAIYWHFPQYSNHGAQSPGGAIRYGDYKLLEYFEHYTVQLFDIKTDPGEQHDLSKLNPEKTKQLRGMLHAWRKEIHANMPTPNPDYDPALNDQWQDWTPSLEGIKKK
jgi:arylsulfatase A-like enzyme